MCDCASNASRNSNFHLFLSAFATRIHGVCARICSRNCFSFVVVPARVSGALFDLYFVSVGVLVCVCLVEVPKIYFPSTRLPSPLLSFRHHHYYRRSSRNGSACLPKKRIYHVLSTTRRSRFLHVQIRIHNTHTHKTILYHPRSDCREFAIHSAEKYTHTHTHSLGSNGNGAHKYIGAHETNIVDCVFSFFI